MNDWADDKAREWLENEALRGTGGRAYSLAVLLRSVAGQLKPLPMDRGDLAKQPLEWETGARYQGSGTTHAAQPPADVRTCRYCNQTAAQLGPVGMWQHCSGHEGGSLTHEMVAESAHRPEEPKPPLGHEFVGSGIFSIEPPPSGGCWFWLGEPLKRCGQPAAAHSATSTQDEAIAQSVEREAEHWRKVGKD